ncbi:MAG: sigma 54-interacting transcriptional regulator [Ignavibacteriales bacterium]|nr:sigma 54-interacting transcriptional regulator [Ignavibacteriales bacterium]
MEIASNQDVTVLITGDSGTGKELVATHIHYLSKRKFNSMVPVNAGGLPADLIESELLDLKKGHLLELQLKRKDYLNLQITEQYS